MTFVTLNPLSSAAPPRLQHFATSSTRTKSPLALLKPEAEKDEEVSSAVEKDSVDALAEAEEDGAVEKRWETSGGRGVGCGVCSV